MFLTASRNVYDREQKIFQLQAAGVDEQKGKQKANNQYGHESKEIKDMVTPLSRICHACFLWLLS